MRLARAGGWRTRLALPGNSVTDVFTGQVYSGAELLLDDLLDTLPVALLAPTAPVEAAA
ncbi:MULTISPECIES: hypothetical protein [unclassified Micromonospora]|uniref:hypothetical protein n=1 Tax=unclassified Micromonospora TaxID=2617518 RepID=UPI00362E965A